MTVFIITVTVIALIMGYVLKIELVGKPINFWNVAYAVCIILTALMLLIMSNLIIFNYL